MMKTKKRLFAKIGLLLLLISIMASGCGDDTVNPPTVTTYTLTYIANGGSPVPADITFTNGQQLTIDSGSSIALTENTFAGWTNAAGTAVSGTITGGSENIVLYASWSVNTYTLSYIGNGGTPVPSDVTFTNGQQITIDSGSSIALTENTFAGWTNAAGTAVSGTITGGSENIVLYASWSVNTYTLSYIGNGGTPVPSDVTFTNGQQITIDSGSSIALAKHGFIAWTNAAGTTVSGTITGTASDITLYASWQYVRFEDNGDGTITDNDNNLMWRKNGRPLGGSAYWSEMNDYCDTNTYAGYSDWRLPEIQELQTLIDTSYTPININTEVFTNMSTSRYISISKWYGLDNYRWYVAFYPTSNETLNTNATSTNSKWYFLPVRTVN